MRKFQWLLFFSNNVLVLVHLQFIVACGFQVRDQNGCVGVIDCECSSPGQFLNWWKVRRLCIFKDSQKFHVAEMNRELYVCKPTSHAIRHKKA